jgi:protein-tyrosine-phosphatase
MAQAIAYAWIQAHQPQEVRIEVCSAGVAAGTGYAASDQAVEVMLERGNELRDHSSQPLTRALIEVADFVFTMTPAHAEAAKRLAPGFADRIFLLDPDHPIADPIGHSVQVYRQVADQLETLIHARLKEIIDE